MEDTTVNDYLIQRLIDAGIEHVFGVPGDYVLDFLDNLCKSSLKWVGTCNELNAGYAADGYARLRGLGAVVVTYGVGGFSVLNAVAGAYAEQVPMIVVSGAPHSAKRQANALVHHVATDFLLQYDIFRRVTCDSAMLTNPQTAPDEIDRIIGNCITKKRPVYLEIPLDIGKMPCRLPMPIRFQAERLSDPDTLQECVEEAAEMVNKAQNPVVLAGLELLRFGLTPSALLLVEHLELPFATTLSSKSALPELHPQFIGIYQGALSREKVIRQVEDSDCVLSLGYWRTDFDTGWFTSYLNDSHMISVNLDQVKIKRHNYCNIWMGDFIKAFTAKAIPRNFLTSHPAKPAFVKTPFHPENDKILTAQRFYDRLNLFLDDRMILLPEPGDAICAAPEFQIEEAENFIAQAFYLSIGYCTPAALGVSLARPNKRAVVIAGDGAFQMTAQEVSTLLKNKCHPIFFLVNNRGYLIERLLHEDNYYNDLQNWKYYTLPGVFGDNYIGLEVKTEGDLEKALATAIAEPDKLIFIEIRIENLLCSEAMNRLVAKYLKGVPGRKL